MTARRTPRATALEVTTDAGECVRLEGRRAEIIAFLAAELATRPQVETLEVWTLEIQVTQGRIIPRFGETGVPWTFRSAFTA